MKILLLLLLALIACQPITDKPFCNPPYFEWQTGQCCLDNNNNTICDNDETAKVIQETTEPQSTVIIESGNIDETITEQADIPELSVESSEQNLMQELIENAPKAYLFWNFNEDAGALVNGDRRSDGYVEYYLALFIVPMSWDVNTKQVLFTAPRQMDERWYNMKRGLPAPKSNMGQVNYFPTYFEINLTGDTEVDIPRIPTEFKKYYWSVGMEKKVNSEKYKGDRFPLIYFSGFYAKGPVDYMKEYASENIVKVDNNSTIISAGSKKITSNLSIYYNKKSDSSKTIVFKFDPKLKIPILIEETDENGKIITRIEFDIQTAVRYQGQYTEILDKHVRPFDNYIIITPQEYEEYHEAVEEGSWSSYFEKYGNTNK